MHNSIRAMKHLTTQKKEGGGEDNPWPIWVESVFGLPEIPADSDGLYHGLVLPRAQYEYLWDLSWLSLASGLYAVARGYYDLSCVPIGVWLTSILYWRKPDYSWRRYLDIGFVHVSLLYQLIRAMGAENQGAYYLMVSIACLCFPLSVYFHKKSSWISTFWHGQVHILGNVANILLYSGRVASL
jgi:hypothetical protein